MTVSNTTVKVTYNGNGSTRTFSIPFVLLSASNLRVVLMDAAGTETDITANYSLSDALDSITYPTVESGLDPVPSGSKLTLVRVTPATQEIDLHSHTSLNAEELESGYDKLTLLVQELKEQLSRAVKFAIGATSTKTAEEFLADIQEAEEQAASAAVDAAASADAAEASATLADGCADAASGSASDAADYATAAALSATTAQNYKNDAGASATLASGYKDDAEAAETAATAAKYAAEGHADTAAEYASAAGGSATAAANSAESASSASAAAIDAKTAAETAQGKAEDAQTAAEAAQAAAEAAAAAITDVDTKIAAHNESSSAHDDIRTALAGKQDTLTAGDNIQIVGNVISATGGGGGGGSANWGSIGGTLSNQTDLKNALDAKAASSHTHTKSQITDFPSIPTKTSDLTNDSGFITSSDLPTVPTKLSDLTDDLGSSPTHTHSQYLESVSWDDVSSKPSSFTPSSHTHTKSEITDFPSIPAKVSDLQNDSGFITDIAVATTSAAGKVKPDGTTITVDSNGTISAAASGGGITATYDSVNKVLTLE